MSLGDVCFSSLLVSKGGSQFSPESYAPQIHGRIRGQGVSKTPRPSSLTGPFVILKLCGCRAVLELEDGDTGRDSLPVLHLGEVHTKYIASLLGCFIVQAVCFF